MIDYSDLYSPYKIVHHPDRIQQLRDGVQTVPLHVQFVPSNVCNNGCVFCPYRMQDYPSNQLFDPRIFMPREKVLESLDCFEDMGVKSVLYSGGGEPTCHPNFSEFMYATVTHGLDLGLITNGLALRPEDCSFLGGAANWVRVSLNAGTPHTYEVVHRRPELFFHQVLDHIATLVEYRTKAVIGVGFMVSRESWQDIPAFIDKMWELGVNNVRLSAVSTAEGSRYFEGWKDEAIDLARAAQKRSTADFKVFDLFSDRLYDMDKAGEPYPLCPCKDLITYVGADCNVYTCCILAYNKAGLIGSIKDQTFKQLWEGRAKHDMFKTFDPLCRCRDHICTYRQKNEFISYCVKADPLDVNFI